jgi:two-component system, chemotaxis family, protein-glutamate methylesterase/glutaminase
MAIRVLIIEDSLTVRARLREVLSSDPLLEVVGEAVDGKEGVELCRSLRPDVITIDMHLPVMSGLSATEYIMAHFPTPILIVSSSMNRGNLFKTYDALAAGAVDVLEKPTGHEPPGKWEGDLLAAVKLISRIKVITHPRARLGSIGIQSTPIEPGRDLPWRASPGPVDLVAIGASTGGPGALLTILQAIPRLPVPLLIVLHIEEPFGTAFAEWLDDQCPHPTRCARGGERLADLAGQVLLAPPGRHLIVKGGVLRLNNEPERHSCRPSVDVLFESIAEERASSTLACLLTGMGRDGATGLLQIRSGGGATIAQDEASSIVYGMPREAALLGAAEKILSIEQIGPAITHALGIGGRR